jgi:hypothetical protein
MQRTLKSRQRWRGTSTEAQHNAEGKDSAPYKNTRTHAHSHNQGAAGSSARPPFIFSATARFAQEGDIHILYIYSISSQYVRACAVARVLPSSCSSRLFQFSLPTFTVAGGSAPSRSRQRQMRVTNRHSKKIAKVHCGALLCSADLDVKDHAPTPASQPSSSSARLGTAVGTQQQAPWWGCLPPRFVYAGARASGC